VLDTYKNATLIQGMFKLITSQNFSFLQNLEGVHLLGVLLLDEQDLAIATLSNDFDGSEVTHTNSSCLGHLPVTHQLHLVD